MCIEDDRKNDRAESRIKDRAEPEKNAMDKCVIDKPVTVLLTGGRAPCTLELARALHKAGHRVLAAESVRHHLCRVSRAVERSFAVPGPNGNAAAFVEALEEIVIRERVEVLIPTCEEIFYVAQGLERLGRYCRVWAAPIEELRELHDKWRFVQLARRLGLSVPPSRLIQSREEWLACASDKDHESIRDMDEGLVLKPAYSRFASRVLILDKRQEEEREKSGKPESSGHTGGYSGLMRRNLEENLPQDLSPEAPWVLQRRIEGRHICTYSVALEGKLVAHAAYPSVYRVGHGATVHFEPVEHEAAEAWVRRLVQATGFTGQIAFDFIEEADGRLYALECNPRATSGLHLFGRQAKGLAQVFVQPRSALQEGVVRPAGSGSRMLTVPMLAAGLGVVRSLAGLREWARAIRRGRDAVFSMSDVRPAMEQALVLLDAWRTSRARGITMAEATTADLEWNGE